MLNFSMTDNVEAIEEMKTEAAIGPDEIPVTLLKNCRHTIAPVIYFFWTQETYLNFTKNQLFPHLMKTTDLVHSHLI